MIYTLENPEISVKISDTGAELQGYMDKATQTEFIWQRDPAVWTGCSPILFPVVGKLKDDHFSIGGKDYNLGKHGFAKKSVFAVENHTDTGLDMVMQDSADTLAHYPWHFELRVRFAIEGRVLTVTHLVTNRSQDTMYFSIGAHPGFQCRIGDTLEFEAVETAGAHRLRPDGLLTDETEDFLDTPTTMTVTKDKFANDALILENLRSRQVTLHRSCPASQAKVSFPTAPCLGIWAKPGASYVCIEPWHGIDDRESVSGAIDKKPMIESLPAGKTFSFPVEIVCTVE